jgi:short chain dehydrogenase
MTYRERDDIRSEVSSSQSEGNHRGLLTVFVDLGPQIDPQTRRKGCPCHRGKVLQIAPLYSFALTLRPISVTTGLGWNTASQLALKGAKVYIGARSEDKAQGAIDAMLEAFPSVQKDNLGIFVADFGDLKQVKAAAERFIASESRLDILVNNAGLYVNTASWC